MIKHVDMKSSAFSRLSDMSEKQTVIVIIEINKSINSFIFPSYPLLDNKFYVPAPMELQDEVLESR